MVFATWVSPTIRGTFLGVPIIKDCCTWGSPILGSYHGFSGFCQGRARLRAARFGATTGRSRKTLESLTYLKCGHRRVVGFRV